MTGGDCRTAPATPGLLNMVDGFVYKGFVVLFKESYKGGQHCTGCFFLNWSPPQNHKFFESPKKLCFFSELKKKQSAQSPPKNLFFNIRWSPPSKQGSSENYGRSNVYDRSEFKVTSNCCYNNCCRTNCGHFTFIYLYLPKFS